MKAAAKKGGLKVMINSYQLSRRGGRSSRGRASFTLRARPPKSVPFKASMALLASSLSFIVTKPKPLERPDSRSTMMVAFSTVPNSPKESDSSCSEADHGRFPTYISIVLSNRFS